MDEISGLIATEIRAELQLVVGGWLDCFLFVEPSA